MNPQHATNWLPGFLMLGVGVAIALVYVLGSRKLRTEAPAPETVDDLDARYQTLLEELRTHKANQHLLPADEFNAEKNRLEIAATDVLKLRDGKKHEQLKQVARAERAATSAPTFTQRNPALIGAIVGGSVVAFFALLGFQLQSGTSERTGGMQVTGMTPPGGERGPMQQQPRGDQKLEALGARVQKDPTDAEAVTDLAIQLIRRQAFQEARPLVARAMLLDPFNPRARVGRAVMIALEGDIKTSMIQLEQLSSKYPDAYDGRMFAGMLAMEDNDPRRALENLEQYVAIAPQSEQPPMMRMAIVQLKQELAGEQDTPPAP